ncbi:MAG TPA: RNA polymerase sigma factor [Vicinamibacterales bacterium]|nr:RNA polymerase sigma factor [Vicinamibacterales bacterium]
MDGRDVTDSEIVQRVRTGETALFEVLMRRHNQRVYRTARAIVKDEAEAEDVMQQAYINAFLHLDQFADRAQFSTWLTRITVHEALSRRRRQRPELALEAEPGSEHEHAMDIRDAASPDPERQAYSGELGRLIESAVDSLPETYRSVFMLRDIEELSTDETAAALDIGVEAVKTRLHRARAMVRRSLTERVGASAGQAFQFHATRCDRVVAAVMTEIRRRVPVSSEKA